MHNTFHNQANEQRGYLLVLVLVFSAVFLMVVFGLIGFIFTQNKLQVARENQEKALYVAEAGLQYYKWFLAHYPTDLQDGTGLPGPYVHDYYDPEGGAMGKFSLAVNGNQQCGAITAIDINSTGWTLEKPNYTRTIYGRYARPSVAHYSYIINSNVWAGSSRVIEGRYHSNGGIRMDGENHSLVTSAQQNWLCTSSFGCSPSQTQPGVFGGGSGSALWQFPVTPIDFAGITLDLVNMKDRAQNGGGLYFGSVGGESNRRGYHAIFKADGTVDVYKVTNTSYVWGVHIDTPSQWSRDYHVITNETFLGNYTIPQGCSVVFFEDRLWIEGVIGAKVTVASADVSQPNYDPDVVINGNITYTTQDGSVGLTLVSEHSILIPLYSPDNMEINAIMIAQKGYFGRNYYPSSYSPWHTQSSLTVNGTIVSNERVGTSWGCSPGGYFCSGYANRTNSYDRKLANDPPPLTPYVDDEYQFLEWGEVTN